LLRCVVVVVQRGIKSSLWFVGLCAREAALIKARVMARADTHTYTHSQKLTYVVVGEQIHNIIQVRVGIVLRRRLDQRQFFPAGKPEKNVLVKRDNVRVSGLREIDAVSCFRVTAQPPCSVGLMALQIALLARSPPMTRCNNM
jgi:hypothetical protein